MSVGKGERETRRREEQVEWKEEYYLNRQQQRVTDCVTGTQKRVKVEVFYGEFPFPFYNTSASFLQVPYIKPCVEFKLKAK